MTKITRQTLEYLRNQSYDHMYKNNDGNLRERYALLISEGVGQTGIYLVECNTSGIFLVNTSASLQEAFQFILNT
jgi:hypothetical protein